VVVVVVVFLLAEMGNHLRLVAPPAAFSLILLLCLGSSPLVSSVQFMEMTVRTGRSIESEADVDYLISKALDTHIKGLSVLMKDDETGLLYYEDSDVPSARSYVSAAAGPDYNSLIKYLISTAHQSGLKVYAWLPMFKDPSLAGLRHDLATLIKESAAAGDGLSSTEASPLFVSPINPEVRNYEQKVISEVLTKFEFDGLRLDFVRFESEFSDLSNHTRNLFLNSYGIDPVTIQSTDSDQWRQWMDFRALSITTFLKEVVKLVVSINPQLDVGAYILPFSASANGYYGSPQTGNDYTHYAGNWIKIMPMIYWQEWATADNFYSWLNETIFYANQLLNAQVVPVFSVADRYSSTKWPLQPNDTMVDFYLSRAFDMASDNHCTSVSLSFYDKWSDSEFQRVAISGDRSMGMSLWNGKQLTLTIFFFLLTTYSFYRLETFFLSLL